MQLLKSNIQRIEKDLANLAKFNRTPNLGHTRFSYSKEEKQAMQYVIDEAKNYGLETKIDAMGNLRAKLVGKMPNAPSIMAGSHLDTVLHGGKFDGAFGVVAALESARLIKENKITLQHPFELIVFTEEEGSNFGVTTLGSKSIAGECSLDYLKNLKNDNGESCYDHLKKTGLKLDNLTSDLLKKEELLVMLELHIEQSIVLENSKIDLGFVEEIAGRKSVWVTLEGASGHAGATPMKHRQDALVGAAEIISAIKEIVDKGKGTRTVVTAGKIECHPNVNNTIAGKVSFSLDIRDANNDYMEQIFIELKKKIAKVAEKNNLSFAIQVQGESDGISLSKRLMPILEKVAKKCNFSYTKMVSGAVHDAAILAKLTQVALIFIPSVKGISHTPEEFSKSEHLQIGSDLLANAILEIDSISK